MALFPFYKTIYWNIRIGNVPQHTRHACPSTRTKAWYLLLWQIYIVHNLYNNATYINILFTHAIILMCLLLPKQSNRIVISELMYLINKSLGRKIIGRTRVNVCFGSSSTSQKILDSWLISKDETSATDSSCWSV